MPNSVSLACRSYFGGFQDLCHNKKAIGLLKIGSYFTGVIPAIVLIVYGVSSLLGRVCCGDKQSSENKKISSVSQKIIVPAVLTEGDLEQFFKSTTRIQRPCSIDGSKVGIIFNPQGGPIDLGSFTTGGHVILVSEGAIPKEVTNKIASKCPQQYKPSNFSVKSVNGQPTLKFFGFEK